MKKMDFDAIAASAPINAVAGLVTSTGSHYDPVIELASHRHSDLPIPTKPIPKESLYSCADIIGKKFGRFTVIGLAAEQNPKKKAAWVVRCACGAYEIRKAPAIKNPVSPNAMCRACWHVEMVKDRYKRLGAAPVETFTKKASA